MGTPIACNDDYYFDAPCSVFSSFLGKPCPDRRSQLLHRRRRLRRRLRRLRDRGGNVVHSARAGARLRRGRRASRIYTTDTSTSGTAGCNTTPPAWNFYQLEDIGRHRMWLALRSRRLVYGRHGHQLQRHGLVPGYGAGTSMTMTVWSEMPAMCTCSTLAIPTCAPSPLSFTVPTQAVRGAAAH